MTLAAEERFVSQVAEETARINPWALFTSLLSLAS